MGYALREILDSETINRAHILYELFFSRSLNPDVCSRCNVEACIRHNIQCEKCPFILTSKTGKFTNIALSDSQGNGFHKLGIEKPNHFGKTQLFFFLNYPQMNFSIESLPYLNDTLLETTESTSREWHLHHINDVHFDDMKSNVVPVLHPEHSYLGTFNTKINNKTITKEEKETMNKFIDKCWVRFHNILKDLGK